MDDTKIIKLYFERSETAIAETARKFGAYLNQVAYNILRCREDTEEIVSDTTLNRIYVGYISESYYDETRSLSPAWIFEYSAVEPHHNTGEEWTQHYTTAYRIKDGNSYYYNY